MTPLRLYGLYWLIACGITWTTIAFATRGGSDATGAADLLANPFLLVAKFGPTLAGLALLAWPQVRRPFRDALARVSPLGLAAAVVVPGLLTAGGLALAGVTGGHDPGVLLGAFSLAGVAYWIAVRTFMGGGLGEEPGLRGVALPLLLRVTGPRRAALILGLTWTLWHLPALIGKPPLIWLAQALLTVSVSLILAFVWRRFGPSLATAIVFHGALNGWAAYARVWAPQLEAIDTWQVARLLALLLIAAAILPLDWRDRTGDHDAP